MSHQYWPTQLKAKQLYGKHSVTLISEEHPFGAKEIVVRKFEITDEKVHVCSRSPSMHAGESVCVGIREGGGRVQLKQLLCWFICVHTLPFLAVTATIPFTMWLGMWEGSPLGEGATNGNTSP